MDKRTEVYYRDNRTVEQHKKDFDKWIAAQKEICKRLEKYFWVESYSDVWWEHKPYSQDADIWYWIMEWKIEIKFTKSKMLYFEWKENQAKQAEEQWIYCLCVANKKVGWIHPKWRHWNIPAEQSYCNKPTRKYRPIWFDSFKELHEYLNRY